MGNIIKFPKKPPTFASEMTSADSCWFNGSVKYVLFAFSSSSKLIVAQKFDKPNDNASKLPINFRNEDY